MTHEAHDDNLIRMANQIGIFFESMSDQKEALAGIAQHLKRFWDPRMRRDFMARVDGPESQHIREIVLRAVREHRDMLT